MVNATSTDHQLDVGQLIGKGILFGMLHVLTGPDHLGALVTLSANVGKCRAFSVGIGWGIGHSTGLLVVATVLLLSFTNTATGQIDIPTRARKVLESLIGVFLILLGVYGFIVAIRRRQNDLAVVAKPKLVAVELANMDDDSVGDDNEINKEKNDIVCHIREGNDTLPEVPLESSTHVNSSTPTTEEQTQQLAEIERHQAPVETGELPPAIANTAVQDQDVTTQSRCKPVITGIRRKQLMSFFMGILHGVAGPGGVLGILPAVQLQNLSLAYTYLASFCISSIITMGVFASLFGVCTERLSRITNLELQIECFSAALCTSIGAVWLSLSFTGKLDAVFG